MQFTIDASLRRFYWAHQALRICTALLVLRVCWAVLMFGTGLLPDWMMPDAAAATNTTLLAETRTPLVSAVRQCLPYTKS